MAPPHPHNPGAHYMQFRSNVVPEPANELESSLERFFQHRVRLLGGRAIKLAPTTAGLPDRLVIFPGAHFFLVELKRQKDSRRSAVQVRQHEKLHQEQGVTVYTLYGRNDIVNWLRGVVSALCPEDSDLV